MGKRKSGRKPQGPKKRDPLPTSFKCVFCNNENSVSVKVEKKNKIGQLSCRDCGQRYQTGDVNNLTQAVDVYYEWIDACDEVAKGHVPTSSSAASAAAHAPASLPRAPPSSHRAGLAPGEKYTAEDDGFIDDDDADAEADYADE